MQLQIPTSCPLLTRHPSTPKYPQIHLVSPRPQEKATAQVLNRIRLQSQTGGHGIRRHRYGGECPRIQSVFCERFSDVERRRLLPITAVSATFRASTIAPRTELFIKFACDELRPEYRVDSVGWGSSNRDIGVSPDGVEMNLTYLPLGKQQQKEGGQALAEKTLVKAMLQRPDKRCRQDAEVHRAAAKLSAGITSAQGIFSVLTTGWWSQVCLSLRMTWSAYWY